MLHTNQPQQSIEQDKKGKEKEEENGFLVDLEITENEPFSLFIHVFHYNDIWLPSKVGLHIPPKD